MNSRRCLLLRSATTAQHKMVHIKSIYSSFILTVSVYFDISHVTNRSECVCCSYATVYEISRFTAELVAEIDELEALIAAPVRNNNENATQNGNYHSIFAYVLVYNIMEYVCYIT